MEIKDISIETLNLVLEQIKIYEGIPKRPHLKKVNDEDFDSAYLLGLSFISNKIKEWKMTCLEEQYKIQK